MGFDEIKQIQINRFLIWMVILAGLSVLILGIIQLMNPLVEVSWSTATEVDTYGYNLLRSNQADGPFDFQVNQEVIEATGQPVSGSDYSFIDRDVKSGMTYYYLLEEVQLDGTIDHFGPIEVRAKTYGWLEIGLSLIVFSAVYYYLRDNRKTVKL